MERGLYDEQLELDDIILLCKQRNTKAMQYMVDKFTPLISKYSYLLNYEDAKQDMTLAFIEVINSIPIQNFQIQHSQYPILGYIKYSIKNKYIYLSKRKNAMLYFENLDSNEGRYGVADDKTKVDDAIMLRNALSILTKRQRKIILLKYYYVFSDIEISQKLSISRQSVNRLKIRALKSLRQYFFGNKVPNIS